jgi:hypothetical protein
MHDGRSIKMQILTARLNIILLDILLLKKFQNLSDLVDNSRRVLTSVPYCIRKSVSIDN